MHNLNSDIEKAVTKKLASIFSDAGAGALLMGGAALPSALLSGYAHDKPLGKQLAETESWALPTGAVLGAFGLPVYRGAQVANNTLSEAAALAPEIIEALKTKAVPFIEGASALPAQMGGASNALNLAADKLSRILSPVAGVGDALSRNLIRMGLMK